MKRFLQKLLLLACIVILVCGACNLAFYLYMGRMTPAYAERFIHAPEKIQVANLGSSHGQSAFCYDQIPDLSAVNLAFGSQTLQYDLRVLENFIDRFERGSVCYILVSYNSLIGADEADGDFLSVNRRYYFFLPRQLIVNFSWKEWLIAKLPGLFVPNWLSQYWKSDEFDEASMQCAYNIDVEADAQEAIERHILSRETADGCVLQQEKIDYLIEMIRLCKQQGITPVLLTTPFLREYNALVPADFLQLQQEAIDQICAQEDVSYLDFSRDTRFIDRYDLFLNSDHMNRHGALMFTNLLLSGAKPEA